MGKDFWKNFLLTRARVGMRDVHNASRVMRKIHEKSY
jgi:hypothetical protein